MGVRPVIIAGDLHLRFYLVVRSVLGLLLVMLFRRLLIRDRGPNFTASFDAVFQVTGTRIVRAPSRRRA